MGGSSSVRGDQTIYHTDNLCFDGTDRGSPMDTDGQLWIGSTASDRPNNGGHVRLGSLTSPLGTLSIGYSAPNITLDLAGGSTAVDSFTLDNSTAPGTNPVFPNASGSVTITGGQVANASLANVIQTHSYAANSYAVTIQRTAAAAAADTTKNGVAHFDSASFDVDANGFVQLNGGGIAATSFDVQANTAPGTDPVVPTAAGAVTVNGAVVANHSVVLETRSRAANAYNLEVQYATSAAATDGTKSGVAHFDSTNFSVDASGFVASAAITLTNGVNGVFSAGTTNLGGSISLRSDILTRTAPGAYPYTALSTDYIIEVDTASARTINLPNAPTTGKSYVIKDVIGSAAANNITLTTVGGVVTIDGAVSKTLASNYVSVTVYFNGTSYFIL